MEADEKSSGKRRRGRPPTLPELERLGWVLTADRAKALALKSARMQEFDRADERALVELPAELQLIVMLCWGCHHTYLNERALALMSPPPRLDRRLRRIAGKLIPKELDPSKWSAKEHKKVDLLKKFRRAAFGKNVNTDAHLWGELVHINQPAYVGGGAWREIDQWCAEDLGVALSTFRSWHRQLGERGLLMQRERGSPSRRRSGRDLIARWPHGKKASK
jgi:hypothetical protein